MRVQAFIFNWPGKKQHAAILEKLFKPHCETTVINSDDSLKLRHPHWQHIGNDAYFTDQWNAALDRFDADVKAFNEHAEKLMQELDIPYFFGPGAFFGHYHIPCLVGRREICAILLLLSCAGTVTLSSFPS